MLHAHDFGADTRILALADDLLRDGYRLIAPKKLLPLLDAKPPTRSRR